MGARRLSGRGLEGAAEMEGRQANVTRHAKSFGQMILDPTLDAFEAGESRLKLQRDRDQRHRGTF